MDKFNYIRKFNLHRSDDRIIDLGNAGRFHEIIVSNADPPDTIRIDDSNFSSVHIIEPSPGKRIFTAYRSGEEPSVLLIIWKDFPFHLQIEEGGDFMLQALHGDSRVGHLIIDNTYVRSGWMNEMMAEYLNKGWMPGLVQLGLRGFCHLQAESYLGGQSFKKFGELVSNNINSIAQILGKDPFEYIPIQTSEMSMDGKIDERMRDSALLKSLVILKSM